MGFIIPVRSWTQPQISSITSLKRLAVEELFDVEVTTVSRRESTVGESPAAIYVINHDRIRRSGATTLPELFRMVPGIAVARIDNNKWAVSARGFNDRFNGKLLVQVDGRTVYSPLFSGVYWDAVDYPLEDIERIEVIRGPGASVWGANAVNGVINIITKSPRDTQGGVVAGRSGTEERGSGFFRYGNEIKNANYRIYGKASTHDEKFSASGNPEDAWWQAVGGIRLDLQNGAGDTFTVQSDFLRSVAERKDLRPMPAAPYSFTNVENEVTNTGYGLARWTRQASDNSSWSVQGYFDHFERKGEKGFVDLRFDTFDVDFQHQFPLGERQSIVYGVGYRYIDAFMGPSRSDSGFAVSFPPPDRTSRLFSAFVQDQVVIVKDTLSLTMGSKFEHNDFTGFEYQPTGRVLFTPTRSHTLWAAASRAVRTPNLSEDGIGTRQLPSFPFGLSGVPVFPQLKGTRDFDSEILKAYEFGYRTQPIERLSVDLSSFYNVYRKLRVVAPSGGIMPGAAEGTFDLPLTFQNRMYGETYGIELAATVQPHERWRLITALTLLKMNLHRDVGLAASVEMAEEQSPSHQLHLQSSWNLPHNLEADLTGRFVGQLSGFDPVVKSYFATDVRFSWQGREDLEIAVVGQNLLKNHRSEFGAAPLLRSLLVENQRSIYLTVKRTF